MKKEFAKEYATAIFDLSLEKNAIEKIKDELSVVKKACEENEAFTKLLTHPQLSKENKKEIIRNVFSSLDQSLQYFLYVLVDNDRFEDIVFINEEFNKLYNEYIKVIHVEAFTTIPLIKEQIEQLTKKLVMKYRHKININNIIDPTVVGGMRLKVNNDVLDYTIKNELSNLKSHIMKQT